MLPLTQLPVEQLFQFLSSEVHGDCLANQRVDKWLQAAAAFFAAEDLTFANDEYAPARPRFDKAISGEIGVCSGDGIGIEYQFLREATNARELITYMEPSRGDREPHLITALLRHRYRRRRSGCRRRPTA